MREDTIAELLLSLRSADGHLKRLIDLLKDRSDQHERRLRAIEIALLASGQLGEAPDPEQKPS
jgi:hypothetical protein